MRTDSDDARDGARDDDRGGRPDDPAGYPPGWERVEDALSDGVHPLGRLMDAVWNLLLAVEGLKERRGGWQVAYAALQAEASETRRRLRKIIDECQPRQAVIDWHPDDVVDLA